MNTERHLGEAGASPPAAGWYDDPARSGWLRRWDGERWTADTRARRLVPAVRDRRARLERLQMAFAVTSLVLFVGVAIAIFVIGPARLHGASPNADELAAAHACSAFRRFLDSILGTSDPANRVVVMRPRLAPRFSGLSADIDAAAWAARAGDAVALLNAGNAVLARCTALSSSAKAAGGFTR